MRYTMAMNDTINTAAPTSHGRLTRHRQAVWEAVAARPEHLTAAQVYDAVRHHDARIAYGTVYNALHYLVDAGLIAEVVRPDGVVAYDRETAPHDHVVCRVCGRFADVPNTGLRAEVAAGYADIARQTGYAIDQHRVTYSGVCPACGFATAARN